MNEAPAVMTMKEVATYLRIHPTTAYRMTRAGILPFFRVGSDYRFVREAIDAWMVRQSGLDKVEP